MTEKIMIVDENDHPTGESMSREQAWKDGRYHRHIRIVLQDENGRFLLQKRSLTKASYPGLWTDAVSGHVDEGETYETTAPRELLEEIGISTKLEKIGVFKMQDKNERGTINTFNCVFKGTIPSSTQLTLEPNEVTEVRWVSLDALKQDLRKNPHLYTPGLRLEIKTYF